MIEPNAWYTIREIVSMRVAPILMSDFKVKRYIALGILKGNTIGKKEGKRYFVKGEEIIKFLAKWEAGDFNK